MATIGSEPADLSLGQSKGAVLAVPPICRGGASGRQRDHNDRRYATPMTAPILGIDSGVGGLICCGAAKRDKINGRKS
jgi:hypothetical protein